MNLATASVCRVQVRVSGVVQGVGYRPFVARRARELDLDGSVRNDTRGVLVDVQGPPERVHRLVADLTALAPPLALVDAVTSSELPVDPSVTGGFSILASEAEGEPQALVAADGATCRACLAELWDPADRRYRYPFLNCTDCGPRFTIVRGVPYDRPLTTMAAFTMCGACQAEYDDPGDRRFHAQPNACPMCGPRVRLECIAGISDRYGLDDMAAASALLRRGAILAIKGLGGYHLACRADHVGAVARLRSRKHREDKPFALMVGDVAAARELVSLDPAEQALLGDPARPIVLARRRPGAAVAPAVAPRAKELGVMLAYTPLHHLLLADAGGPLVMTSGNRSDEPIAYRDADAGRRLGGIADAILFHDRPIHMRTDDSVARVVAGRRTVLRRARGLVPGRLALPVGAAVPILACGAQLKSTFCVAKGTSAWVSHHIGDLDDHATRESFTEGIEHFQRLFAVSPEVVVHDEHPGYASTAYARERDGVRQIAVQHHHAHLAAVLAEHGHDGPAVGAIYDGAGYGSDGTVWGGELLVGDLRTFVRAGQLWPVTLPGGDRAAQQPWRMAAAWLVAAGAGGGAAPPVPDALRAAVRDADWHIVCEMARRGFQAPVTSSMGRLFDAIAALCGVRATCTYEGQAAIELEALARRRLSVGGYELPLTPEGRLDARPLVRAVVSDLDDGVTVADVSARFHATIAETTTEALARLADVHDTGTVVLAGGVFHNRLLLESTITLLERRHLDVLVPERLPAGDGAISFGQAAVAAARLSDG